MKERIEDFSEEDYQYFLKIYNDRIQDILFAEFKNATPLIFLAIAMCIISHSIFWLLFFTPIIWLKCFRTSYKYYRDKNKKQKVIIESKVDNKDSFNNQYVLRFFYEEKHKYMSCSVKKDLFDKINTKDRFRVEMTKRTETTLNVEIIEE